MCFMLHYWLFNHVYCIMAVLYWHLYGSHYTYMLVSGDTNSIHFKSSGDSATCVVIRKFYSYK